MIEETKIKEKLEKFLNRKPSKGEIQNGYKDQNIINECLSGEIDILNTKVALLEEKIK